MSVFFFVNRESFGVTCVSGLFMCSVLLLNLTNTAIIYLWLENGASNSVTQINNAICLPTWTRTGDHVTWVLTLLQGLYHVTASQIFSYKRAIALPLFLLLSVQQVLCSLPINHRRMGVHVITRALISKPSTQCLHFAWLLKVDKLRGFEFDSFIWSLLYLISFFDLARDVHHRV